MLIIIIMIIVIIIILVLFHKYYETKKNKMMFYEITLISFNNSNNPLSTSNILFVVHNNKFIINDQILYYLSNKNMNDLMLPHNTNINSQSQISGGMNLPGMKSTVVSTTNNEYCYLSMYTKILQTNEIILLQNFDLRNIDRIIGNKGITITLSTNNQPIYIKINKICNN
jgi:hypothetical protein